MVYAVHSGVIGARDLHLVVILEVGWVDADCRQSCVGKRGRGSAYYVIITGVLVWFWSQGD